MDGVIEAIISINVTTTLIQSTYPASPTAHFLCTASYHVQLTAIIIFPFEVIPTLIIPIDTTERSIGTSIFI
jgi:hypothetical protein